MSQTQMRSGLISEKKDSSPTDLQMLRGENDTFTCAVPMVTNYRSRARDWAIKQQRLQCDLVDGS